MGVSVSDGLCCCAGTKEEEGGPGMRIRSRDRSMVCRLPFVRLRSPVPTRHNREHEPSGGITLEYIAVEVEKLNDLDWEQVHKGGEAPEIWKSKSTHVNKEELAVKISYRFKPEVTLFQIIEAQVEEGLRKQWDKRLAQMKLIKTEHSNLYLEHMLFKKQMGTDPREMFIKFIIVDDPESGRLFLYTNSVPPEAFGEEAKETEGACVIDVLVGLTVFEYSG